MTDENNTEEPIKSSTPLPDQLSNSIYQFATLYELWKKDRSEFAKTVRNLEIKNGQLEEILSRFSTVDEDFKRTLRMLIEGEVNRFTHNLGEKIGESSAIAAKAALDKTTQRFDAEIRKSIQLVDRMNHDFINVNTWNKWNYAIILLMVFVSAFAGAYFMYSLTKDKRFTRQEVELMRLGGILGEASSYLTQEERDTIYGFYKEGKDYVRPKKSGSVPKKSKKSALQG